MLVADMSRLLRVYGDECKKLSKEQNIASKSKIDKLRAFYIERIANVIPHHCGDHSNCRADDCVMLQIQRKVISKHRPEEKACDTKLSDKEWLYHYKSEINTRHDKQSRLKGKIMNMGKDGQDLVLKEVTKRLNESNVDRVAIAMSSNGCENLFSMLAKCSLGKRMHFGRTDS